MSNKLALLGFRPYLVQSLNVLTRVTLCNGDHYFKFLNFSLPIGSAVLKGNHMYRADNRLINSTNINGPV